MSYVVSYITGTMDSSDSSVFNCLFVYSAALRLPLFKYWGLPGWSDYFQDTPSFLTPAGSQGLWLFQYLRLQTSCSLTHWSPANKLFTKLHIGSRLSALRLTLLLREASETSSRMKQFPSLQPEQSIGLVGLSPTSNQTLFWRTNGSETTELSRW